MIFTEDELLQIILMGNHGKKPCKFINHCQLDEYENIGGSKMY